MLIRTGQKRILGMVVIAGVICLAVSWYVADRESDMQAALQVVIAEQETTLAALAELIDRDGADAVVTEIIKDCTPVERDRFDVLLGSLSTNTPTELQELDSLFSACGNYFAQRKAVMVARFEREVEVYGTYVSMYALLDSRADTAMYPVADWKRLVTLELERRVLVQRLVEIQRLIIDELLKGTQPKSEPIQLLLGDANEMREQVGFVGMQIDSLRESIFDL